MTNMMTTSDPAGWDLLKQTIYDYGELDVAETWGNINQHNALAVSQKICCGKNLFDFLLSGDYFTAANILASNISLVNDSNIQLVYDKHHSIYMDTLKILCTDQMILLYENYDGMNNEESTMQSDWYRTNISQQYEKILSEAPIQTNIIMDLITEFKFLTHPYLENFCRQLVQELSLDTQVTKFCLLYKQYIEFVPLVYRVINEYYLEYTKYQLKMIDDLHNNSIIVSEYYSHLRDCLQMLPINYIDYRYQDSFGNNMIIYLAMLPYLSKPINQEIYQELLNQDTVFPLDLKNLDGDTVFHIVAQCQNEIFLELLVHFVETNCPAETNTLGVLLNIENYHGKTMIDILLEKNNLEMVFQIIKYLPFGVHATFTDQFMRNFEILDKLPDDNEYLHQIYVNSINYFLDSLLGMKQDILYDIPYYTETKLKTHKLLDKFSGKTSYHLEWLFIAIQIDEPELFEKILSIHHKSKHHKFGLNLNQFSNTGETLIECAIKHQNIPIIGILLDYHQIDLNIINPAGKTAIIFALETNNLYIIQLVRNYIQNNSSYNYILPIVNSYANLLEQQKIFNVLSFEEILSKLWHSIEYWGNKWWYGITKIY